MARQGQANKRKDQTDQTVLLILVAAVAMLLAYSSAGLYRAIYVGADNLINITFRSGDHINAFLLKNFHSA